MDDVAGDDGVTGGDFSDEKKAIAWLESKTPAMRKAIACRSALRVLSNICCIHDKVQHNLAIALFRGIFTSTASTSEPAMVHEDMSSGIALAGNFAANKSAHSRAMSQMLKKRSFSSQADAIISQAESKSLESLANSVMAAVKPTSDAATVFVAINEAALSAMWATVAANQRASTQSGHGDPMKQTKLAVSFDANNHKIRKHDTPLWPSGMLPDAIQRNHDRFLTLLSADRITWSFWHDWYLAMWEGRLTDWDLAIEVAKIPDDVWEQGAEAVAAEIAKIEARRALEIEIASLKAQLREAQAVEAPAHRLHNNPPEAIESERQLKGEITLIWGLLETAEAEIAKPDPSPSELRQIADALVQISLRIAAYCGSLADVVLRESAKTVGNTGTKAIIGAVVTTTAAQNEGVKAVVNAIWEFVKTLPAG